MKTKKYATFSIQDMLPIGLAIVVFGIGIAYGINVLADVKDDLGACENASYSYNESNDLCTDGEGNYTVPSNEDFIATNQTIEGVANIPEKLPLIVTVIVASIIIGILVRYLMVRYS